ncbi:hypothetical protein [Ruegeria profundi]|nr:hypothetical protein [Ruegeria profundi]
MAQDDGLSSWDWTAEAYFWGADLGGETTSGDDINMPIDDIIDDLKFGVMGSIFAEKGDWLLFADAFYLDLGDSDDVSANIGPIDVDVRGSFDLKGFSSTFGAGYKIMQNAGTTLHAVGGVRFLWLDSEVEVNATESISGSPIDGQVITDKEVGNNWDAIIGLRGVTELNDKWYLSYYGDVGAGNSELTWQASLAANYRMARADLVFGYRYLDFDLDDFGPIDDLNLGGPFVGVKVSF